MIINYLFTCAPSGQTLSIESTMLIILHTTKYPIESRNILAVAKNGSGITYVVTKEINTNACM